MENKSLDCIDKLFIDIYNNFKTKKDVRLVPYKANPSHPEILTMEYTTSQGVNTTFKLNKDGYMYNLRSEKHYKSMNIPQACAFAANIGSKYEGYRCNAYDDIMIIQLTDTFRNMRDNDIVELIKKRIEEYIQITEEEFSAFEESCEVVSVEENIKEETVPENISTEKIEKVFDVEEESEATDFETEDIFDLDSSEEKIPDFEEEKIVEDVFDFEYEEPKEEYPNEDNDEENDDINLDKLLTDFSDEQNHEEEIEEDIFDFEYEESKEECLKEEENDINLDKILTDISNETDFSEEYDLVHDNLISSEDSANIRMTEYLKKNWYENKIKYTHTEDKMSANYYDDENIRYAINYAKGTLEIKISKKVEDTDKNVLEQIQKSIDPSAYITKRNILFISRTIECCTPDKYRDAIADMLMVLQKIEQYINKSCDENIDPEETLESEEILEPEGTLEPGGILDIVSEAKKEEFTQWQILLDQKEEFLNNEKEQIVHKIQDLNTREKYITDKEVEIQENQKVLENDKVSLSLKQQDVLCREILVNQKEKTLTEKEKEILQKEESLNKIAADLNEKETSVNKTAEKVKNDQNQINEKQQRLDEKERLFKKQYETVQIKTNSMLNQIRLLEAQKKDLEDIISIKLNTLNQDVSVDKMEKEISSLKNSVEEADRKITNLSENLHATEVEKENLQNKVSQVVRVYGKTKKEYEKTEKNNEELIKKLRNAEKRHKELTKELRNLKSKYDQLKNEEVPFNPDALEKVRDELEQIKKENEALKQQVVFPATKDIPDSESEEVGVSSDEFKSYLMEEKEAEEDMIEELHSDKGNLLKINGNIQILISFKKEMKFIECVRETHASGKMIKKIEAHNAQSGKTILFTTDRQIFGRTMLQNETCEEIYKIMEETTNILAEL